MISYIIILYTIIIVIIISIIQQYILIDKLRKDKIKNRNKRFENNNYYIIENEDKNDDYYRKLYNNNIIKRYDEKKIYDVLEEPSKRPSRSEIGDIGFRRYINISTQGYPDNYHLIGILMNNEGFENRILKLYGREKYPRSIQWEYYTIISDGNDMIKIEINNKNNKELYTGDKIYIEELKKEYEVKMYSTDELRYNPNIY